MNKDLLKQWYGITSSEEIDPEQQQEMIDAQIDQAIENRYHSHTERK